MTTNRPSLLRAACCLGILLFNQLLQAAAPEWIWHDDHGAAPAPGEVRYFRTTFKLKDYATKALFTGAADDEMEVYLNGKKVLNVVGWEKAVYLDVTTNLALGENVLAIRATNNVGDAAILALLQITLPKHNSVTVVSDASWKSSAELAPGWNAEKFDSSHWTKAVSRGAVGVKPWGDVIQAAEATSPTNFTLAPGFQAELLRSAQPWEGSWISMTIDPKGRLIISPQEANNKLLRITLTKKGQVAKVEPINQPVASAMGLLYAFDSLYVNGSGPDGLGLYRLRYNRHTDSFQAPELLKKIEGAAGEHGSHAVVLGPDKNLYIVNGNFTKVPADIAADSPHKNYAEDQLLPRSEDGNGFGIGVKPPGGFILKTDKDGKKWELFDAGMRNTYDIAFNPDGEIFGFDSDMEYDWGTPWYRPIRICHLVSGGDYGFREGTGKFPKYYPDTLPSTVDVGIGSPTGMKFGTDSNFPEKYKTALFALDWSYGRIFAVHLTPDGATYDANFETFLKGKPLNLTDLEFGKDGAMYFITGGRGTQSGLYRVSYAGPKSKHKEPSLGKAELAADARARKLRHELEAFQGKPDPKAVDFVWPHLDSEDRWIRYAARIALESQPLAEWKDRALAETRTNAGLTALLALARLGGPATQTPLLQALAKFPFDGLSLDQKLDKLRVIELSFIRQGKPDAELAQFVIQKLDPHYPATNEYLNRELCQLLVYLQAPDVVAKTLKLLDAAPAQEEQIFYILHLRTLKTGWTLEQREHYLSWFDRDREETGGETARKKRQSEKPQHSKELVKWFSDADRDYSDGASFPKFLVNFRKDAIESLSDPERIKLAYLISDKKPEKVKPPAAPPRKFVNDWKMADLEPELKKLSSGRSFANGKATFTTAQCVQCHRFDNHGGSVGPELTAIASRYNHHDILESILEPSKVISEQFQNTLIIKKDGDDVTGRVVEENDQRLVLVTDALTQTKAEVLKSEIQTRQPSKISPMPEGLMNSFTQDDILDLIAYLESGGKETAPAFQKSK